MNINRLKIGQKVWIHNGEFPVQECVVNIHEDGLVELTDGHPHDPNEIYSTKQRCIQAN